MTPSSYRGKMPVLGWSLHMTGGWQAHLARVERWYRRAALAKNEHDQLDFLFAFFESSFWLRDWLIDTGAIPQPEMETLFAKHVELRINRVLANSLKHHSIHRVSQEQPPSIAIEYAPEYPTYRDDSRLVILSEGVKYDALALAKQCLSIWIDLSKSLSV
jgi:hypothetical protein